jgi:hypothetical protein
MEETYARCESIRVDVPDHSKELLKAEQLIEKLKNRLKITGVQRAIDDDIHTKTFDEVVFILMYIGDLSMSVFNLGNDLEKQYVKAYIKTPELAKTLWLKHQDRLHHPYNILKNRCYKLLEELDAQYHKKFDRHPPNWKI